MACSHAAARLACAVHSARAMTTARPAARATMRDAVRVLASRALASRARAGASSRTAAAASSNGRANDGSLGRERAADLARANEEEAYDDDPLVHMGRINKSALKRLAHEKKTMAKTLLALPKSQIATMEELNAEVKALVAEGKKLKGNHGAAKRHEGALAGALRRMTESEMDALVSKVTAIENGTTGAIDSNVDALAMSWRARLLSGTEATTASSDDATACLGEIFDALATAEANETSAPLSFTRQELKVALDAATKESRARALAIAEFNASIDKEMEVLAYGETNEEVLRETRAFIAQKLKSGGGASATPSRSPPRAKSSKRLLGMLRDVAAVVVAA